MRIAAGLALIVYVIFSILDSIASERDGSRRLKPLLMPVLAAFFLLALAAFCPAGQPGLPLAVLIICALACGFGGDVLLLSGDRFIPGAISFLAGHIFYMITAWIQIKAGWAGLRPAFFVSAVCYICFGIIVGTRLLAGIEKDMKPPVLLYIIVILAMSWTMSVRFFCLGGMTVLTFIGSMIFVSSDLILAIDTFYKKGLPGIMETYTAAQLLVVLGFLL